MAGTRTTGRRFRLDDTGDQGVRPLSAGKRSRTASLPPGPASADSPTVAASSDAAAVGVGSPIPQVSQLRLADQRAAEALLGTDLSQVRLHTDSLRALDLNAHAFAEGQDIHFAPGAYDPDSRAGRELLGHELGHVAQHQHGRATGVQLQAVDTSAAQSPLEAEADAIGAQLASPEVANSPDPDQRAAEIKEQYGVRPRKYSGVLDDTHVGERLFRSFLPEVTAFMNQRSTELEAGITFTQAEIATNFLMEGGILLLMYDMVENIDGFAALGIDTFMDRYAQVEPWLHPCLARDKLVPQQAVNERGETVTSISELNIMQGMYASAAMWAVHKRMAERDMQGRGTSLTDLGDEREMFWSTAYFNAGPGFGQRMLGEQGTGWADQPWTGTDDHEEHGRNARYNASVRTATYTYLRDIDFDEQGNMRSVDEVRARTGGGGATSDAEELAELVTIEGGDFSLDDPVPEDQATRFQLLDITRQLRGIVLDKMAQLLAALEAAPQQASSDDEFTRRSAEAMLDCYPAKVQRLQQLLAKIDRNIAALTAPR